MFLVCYYSWFKISVAAIVAVDTKDAMLCAIMWHLGFAVVIEVHVLFFFCFFFNDSKYSENQNMLKSMLFFNLLVGTVN